MLRFSVIVSLLLLAGCADQSEGAALNECRLKYFLESPKSFQMASPCSPESDDDWDWQVRTFTYDNPRCYRPLGATAWTATILSPM
jgi:hypothetical protein